MTPLLRSLHLFPSPPQIAMEYCGGGSVESLYKGIDRASNGLAFPELSYSLDYPIFLDYPILWALITRDLL